MISKPYPRKGTETSAEYHVPYIWTYFKTISPQGDGNSDSEPLKVAHGREIFQNHIPVRGRKRDIGALYMGVIRIISKPYPRKGTETITRRLIPTLPLPISKPYPRKGTETRTVVSHVINMKRFQNHIPARGRSVPPASPARAGEGDRVSGGGGAMNASRKPSIATEVHARHKRPPSARVARHFPRSDGGS